MPTPFTCLTVPNSRSEGKYGRSPIVLRPYQLESCNKILESWRTYDRVLLVLPTAGGKTIVFSSVAALEKRRSLALATWKQVRLMIRLGHQAAHLITFKEASAWIDQALRSTKGSPS